MTQEEQRVALAEWALSPRTDGVVEYQRFDSTETGFFQRVRLSNRTSPCYTGAIKDYPSDLNAVHELVIKLERETGGSSVRCLHRDYLLTLMQMLNPDVKLWDNGTFLGSWGHAIKVEGATASQRCEALCRVLWPERWK